MRKVIGINKAETTHITKQAFNTKNLKMLILHLLDLLKNLLYTVSIQKYDHSCSHQGIEKRLIKLVLFQSKYQRMSMLI